MPETVLQERTISGRGVFRLDEEFKECKRIILYASVIRPPSNPYLNVTWRPNKGFYANVTLSFEGYVGIDVAMNFPEQLFIIHQNDSQQLGAALVCHLQVVSDGIWRLGQLVGGNFVLENPIENFAYSAFIYDEVKFSCYSGTAISLRILGEITEKCDPEDAPPQNPPPPPPPSQPPVPPGTPVEVDEPYPDEPPEDPDTQPDPIDEFPTPETCRSYGLFYRIISAQFPAPGLEASQPFVGEFEGLETSPGASSNQENLGFRAGQNSPEGCIPGFYYSLFDNLELPYDFEILEIREF